MGNTGNKLTAQWDYKTACPPAKSEFNIDPKKDYPPEYKEFMNSEFCSWSLYGSENTFDDAVVELLKERDVTNIIEKRERKQLENKHK